MAAFSVGPGGPTIGPGGGLLGPLPSVTVEVPAGVVTVSGPPPTPSTTELIVAVPAGELTLTSAPSAAVQANVGAGTVTTSGPTINLRVSAGVPAGVVTTSGPTITVRTGYVIPVPAGVVTLTSHLLTSTYTSGVSLEGPVQLYLNGAEITDKKISWDISTEEVLGGVGTAHLTIQDRLNTTFEPEPHMDVIVQIRSSGWRLFHGETMSPSVSLPPAMPYRIWSIECRDYNAQLAERLVGAPVETFYRPSVKEPYRPVDPAAISGGTDKTTVQQWFQEYFRFPNYASADTSTYVFEYVDNAFLGATENIMWLYDAHTTLAAALADLATAAEVNVQGWLMPDDKFAWLEIPTWQSLVAGGATGDLPAAPTALPPTRPATLMSLAFTKDGGSMPEALYAQGATTWVYDPTVSHTPVAGSSGWYPVRAQKNYRQAYLPIPGAWTEETRNRLADAAYRRAIYPTLRGNAMVQGIDGWRAGQYVEISDPRLPPSMHDGGTGVFVIQRVATHLYSGTDVREYSLDFGDGPVGRIAQYATRSGPPKPVGILAQPPIVTWVVDWENYGPIAANETREFVATPTNGKGDPWGPPGMPVTLTVEAVGSDGTVVAGEGTITPSTTTTDQDGKVRAVLASSTTRSDLYYTVKVYSPQAPA